MLFVEIAVLAGEVAAVGNINAADGIRRGAKETNPEIIGNSPGISIFRHGRGPQGGADSINQVVQFLDTDNRLNKIL